MLTCWVRTSRSENQCGSAESKPYYLSSTDFFDNMRETAAIRGDQRATIGSYTVFITEFYILHTIPHLRNCGKSRILQIISHHRLCWIRLPSMENSLRNDVHSVDHLELRHFIEDQTVNCSGSKSVCGVNDMNSCLECAVSRTLECDEIESQVWRTA